MKQYFLLFFILINISFIYAQNTSNLTVSPNPFYSSASINFQVTEDANVTLKVNNLQGNIVKEYFNSSYLSRGLYSLNLVGNDLADGIYFVSLTVGTANTITQKIVKDVKVVSISESNTEDKNIIFYPNPSNSIITIPFEGIKNIIITDFNGRVIKKEKISTKEISILDLANGQYFVTVLSDKQEIISVQKIIKVE
ncbi:MAG: T9SS type A sorting domain-containing protein [Bacteroidota bacterium]